MKASWIDTPLGPLLAVADEKALYSLEFAAETSITLGKPDPIQQIESELKKYFSGKLKAFQTPLALVGSPFQKRVWEELQKIPYGETRSYAEIARAIGNPSAFRAVGLANGANRLPLIIPCHRVINQNGNLGGYSGGIEKKEWLLNHEQK